jgi:hypothetical protein
VRGWDDAIAQFPRSVRRLQDKVCPDLVAERSQLSLAEKRSNSTTFDGEGAIGPSRLSN